MSDPMLEAARDGCPTCAGSGETDGWEGKACSMPTGPCPECARVAALLSKVAADRDQDAMMAGECLAMVAETLSALGCKHGNESHKSTPAMMYPEWIKCVVSHHMAKVAADEREACAKVIRKRVEFWVKQFQEKGDCQASDCFNESRHLLAAIQSRTP